MNYVTIILLILITLIALIIVPLLTVYFYGKKYILYLNELPKKADVVIVLGAGIRADGKPCDLLADRLEVGAMVYITKNCYKVLLTGDNRDVSRNEVDVMKKWIVDNWLENEIEEENILLDNIGYCTSDSMFTVKSKFNTNNAIISTNKYHLPRAIYMARKLGIIAWGISSDLRKYDRMKSYMRRELLARIKDYYLINIKILKIHIMNLLTKKRKTNKIKI